jgi:hypothetical protein
VLSEQLLQSDGQRVDVDHLAVTHDARGERSGGGTLDGNLSGAALNGGDVTRLDVETYDCFSR